MSDPCEICGVTLEKDRACCLEPDCPERVGEVEDGDG